MKKINSNYQKPNTTTNASVLRRDPDESSSSSFSCSSSDSSLPLRAFPGSPFLASPGPSAGVPPIKNRKSKIENSHNSHSSHSSHSPENPITPSLHHSIPPALPVSPIPRFALNKGLGYWQLIFNGATAYFKHEQGAAYVAYLLLNPPDQPIHALNLALKIRAASGADTELSDPIQQRNLGLDDAEAARVLRKKQLELEAIVDSEDPEITEPVKAEALSELEAIYTFQKSQAWRPRDAAQRAVRAVTMAIKRFHGHLASARDANNQPHAVLRAFAQHIHDYILLPSGRGNGPGGSRLSRTSAGCLTYEPPPGVIWTT